MRLASSGTRAKSPPAHALVKQQVVGLAEAVAALGETRVAA